MTRFGLCLASERDWGSVSTRCATQKWRSCRPACLPVILEAAIEVATSQGDDRVGAANGPEHAGLFQAGANDGLAASLDHTGADEEVLLAELGVAHPLCVPFEIVGLNANLFGHVGIGRPDGTNRVCQLFNLSLVETFLVDLHPSFLATVIVW